MARGCAPLLKGRISAGAKFVRALLNDAFASRPSSRSVPAARIWTLVGGKFGPSSSDRSPRASPKGAKAIGDPLSRLTESEPGKHVVLESGSGYGSEAMDQTRRWAWACQAAPEVFQKDRGHRIERGSTEIQ